MPTWPAVRDSDRWITPRVVVAGMLVLGALVALLIVAVGYLSVRGVDPAPMVKTVGALVAGASSLVTLLVQLATRSTVAKTERNTGQQASALYALADHVDARLEHLTAAPVRPPPPPARHRYPDTGVVDMGRPRRAGE